MRVIGIDPGSRICGYGIIEWRDGGKYIASGRIEASRRAPLHIRLREIHDALVEIIRQYRPADAAIEKVFFAKGARAALNLGHARGISLLAASSEGLSVYEYTASEVKKAIVGYGRAEKRQVQEMVMVMLDLNMALSPDSADALALSICHLNTIRLIG
ncbi:MAG: crossover junction endodeoxyribonuclease RuvC [Thermodesulfovibrionales bacterium]